VGSRKFLLLAVNLSFTNYYEKGESIMVAMPKEEIIAKIMKLLALGSSEQNDNPHERETASRRAAKMMADWSIDFAELRSSKPKEDTFVTYEVDGSEDRKVDFESALAGSIARAFDCKIINTWSKTLNPNSFVHPWVIAFVGSKHDLEISVYFFKHIRRTMYAMAAKNVTIGTVKPRNGRRATGTDVNMARRNYCFGMVESIAVRMEDLYMKREEFIPSDCKALVVVKKQGLEKYFNQQFPNSVKGRRTVLRGDLGAYTLGIVDGKRVNLSRPISNSGNQSAQIG